MVLKITLTGREPAVTSITSRPKVCGRNEFQEKVTAGVQLSVHQQVNEAFQHRIPILAS